MSYSENAAQPLLLLQFSALQVVSRRPQVARGELLHIFMYKPTEMQQIFMATRERVKNKKKRKGKKPET